MPICPAKREPTGSVRSGGRLADSDMHKKEKIYELAGKAKKYKKQLGDSAFSIIGLVLMNAVAQIAVYPLLARRLGTAGYGHKTERGCHYKCKGSCFFHNII